MIASRRLFRTSITFVVLLIAVLCGMSQANATTTVPTDPCVAQDANGNTYNQQMQSIFTNQAATKAKAMDTLISQQGAISVQMDYCLNKIREAITAIGSMASSANPFNVYNFIMTQLYNIAVKAIIQIISGACSAALAGIKALADEGVSILNKLCLPLPSINLSMGTLSSSSPTAPCPGGGVPLIQPSPTPYGMIRGDYRSFFPPGL